MPLTVTAPLTLMNIALLPHQFLNRREGVFHFVKRLVANGVIPLCHGESCGLLLRRKTIVSGLQLGGIGALGSNGSLGLRNHVSVLTVVLHRRCVVRHERRLAASP